MCTDVDSSEKMQYSSSTSSILTAILVSTMCAFDTCSGLAAVSKTGVCFFQMLKDSQLC